jgi:hypothetical protein
MFFSWISFTQALEYPIRTLSIFFENSQRYTVFAAQGSPHVLLKPVANGKKSLIRKVFDVLFGHLWEVELTYR